MKKSTLLHRMIVAMTIAVSGASTYSHAGLVEVNFSTLGITGIGAADPFKLALDRAGINVAPPPTISGRFYYEDSTADTNASSAIGGYNGALDSLSFSVGSWFSQSLSNILLNGDITVRNNTGSGNSVIDSVTVSLTGVGGQGAGQLAYSFFDPGLTGATSDDVTWVLDQFTLTLTQNPPGAGLPTLLSATSLPTEPEWESTAWTARSVSLRFNPTGTAGNQVVAGTIDFLAVPEPGSLALLGLGLAGLAGLRRRKSTV